MRVGTRVSDFGPGTERDTGGGSVVTAGAVAAADSPPPAGRTNLKARLILGDLVAVTLAWATVLLLQRGLAGQTLLDGLNGTRWAATGAAVTLAAIYWQRLYLAAVSSVRTVEVQRLARAALFGSLASFFTFPAAQTRTSLPQVAAAGLVTFLALAAERGAYRCWLRARRRAGLSVRPIVLVGDNDEALALTALLTDHPELGFRVAATVADGREAKVLRALADSGAHGVMVASTAVSSRRLNALVRVLMDRGVHVHMSSGLTGIAHQRVHSVPMAHEPLLYVEPASLSRWQHSVKRAIDVAVAGVSLALAAPVLGVLALAIKLEDGGPVLFCQDRVGQDGRLFRMCKLRSMGVDAEDRLAELRDRNQRDGALFKLAADPRVTRIGRLLRATSLDELPQLLNVLQGSMSLVGPRPALPREAAAFDTELQGRHAVKPGITGLWQVEARDNPSFNPYRRLDLFYVENWSVGLDLSILLATFFAVLGRGVRVLVPTRRRVKLALASAVLD